MKSIIRYFLFWLFLLIFTSVLLAQGNLGQAGANFLQIGVEPRGAALGGAMTAAVEGSAALYWNPAAAAFVENIDILFSYTDWFLDTKLAYGGIIKNFGSLGVLGFSVTSLYMDKMEITTVYAGDGTNEFYEAGDIAIGLSYARTLTDRFTFGATIKYVHEYIWNETAAQIAFDVGSVYRTDFHNLKIGMSVQNFAGKLKFEGDNIDKRIEEETNSGVTNNPRIERLTPEFRLPQVFHLGIAFDPIAFENSSFTLMADVDVPSDNEQRISTALEYGFRNFAFLRGSYRLNYDAGSFAFGAGIKTDLMGLNSHFDYAVAEYAELGSVHRFGIGLSF